MSREGKNLLAISLRAFPYAYKLLIFEAAVRWIGYAKIRDPWVCQAQERCKTNQDTKNTGRY